MKRLISICALLLPSLAIWGCGGSTSRPPATEAEYKANLPDEVREAEEKFQQKAKTAVEKRDRKSR